MEPISLDKNIENLVVCEHKSRDAQLSPYAAADFAALRKTPLPCSALRDGFTRDCEVVINLKQFNRYADKTQVVSLRKNDDVSNRNYHVQLVSRVSRTIGAALGLNSALLEAISLAHDFGHAPFGHRGETALNAVTSKYGYVFKHHFQSARYLYQINNKNVSYQVIDGALGHNGEKLSQCYEPRSLPRNPFSELDEKLELCYAGKATDELLKPCTLEGCLVRVCDVIAYVGKDRQDAMQLEIAGGFDAKNSEIISSMSNDIVNNSYGKNYVALSDKAYETLSSLVNENYEKIYRSEKVLGAYAELPRLFEEVFDFLYKDAANGEKVLSAYHYKYMDYAKGSDVYRKNNAAHPERICADFIAGMCDDYLVSFYEHFKKDNPDWRLEFAKTGYFDV